MNKLFRLFAYLVCLLIVAMIVLVATKSQLGYPKIQDLNKTDWTEAGPLELSPERGRFALLYSIVEDKSFQFEKEVARLATPDLGYKNGKFVSLFAPGTSIIMIPGYILGQKIGATHLMSSLTVGLFAIFNVILLYAISKKIGASTLASMLGAMIFLVATPAFTYAGVIYQHHISTFLLLCVVFLSLHSPNLWRLAMTYLLLGLSVIFDYPNAFFMLPVILYSTFQFIKIVKSNKGILIKVNFGILLSIFMIVIPLAIYLYINQLSYGNAFQLSNTVSHIQSLDIDGNPVAGVGADERAKNDIANLGVRKRSALNFFKSRHLINGLYAFSVSPDRSVLVFSPVIILGFLGIFLIHRKNPSLSQMLLSIVVINVLLYAMRSDPWGGWAFGSRYLIPSFAILSIPLAVAISSFRRHWLFIILLLASGGYSIYVNTAGAISSTANPPQVEILGLEALSGRRERFSFDRNIEYLQNGKSKSFIYNTYLSNVLTPIRFYQIVAGTLSGIFAILMLLEITRKSP